MDGIPIYGVLPEISFGLPLSGQLIGRLRLQSVTHGAAP